MCFARHRPTGHLMLSTSFRKFILTTRQNDLCCSNRHEAHLMYSCIFLLLCVCFLSSCFFWVQWHDFKPCDFRWFMTFFCVCVFLIFSHCWKCFLKMTNDTRRMRYALGEKCYTLSCNDCTKQSGGETLQHLSGLWKSVQIVNPWN